MTSRSMTGGIAALLLIACLPARAGAQRIPPPDFRTPALAALYATTPYAGAPPMTLALRTAPARSAGRATSRRRRMQIVGGALGALAVGLVAFGHYDDAEGPDRRVKGDEGYTPRANQALAIGGFVGATAASYLIGRGDGSHGSLLATAVGAAIPTIPVALMYDRPEAIYLGVLISPLQGLGAELGYQRTRR